MSKVKLEVGMSMWCAIKGNLAIQRIDTKLAYPIILNAGGLETVTYHEDGSHFTGFNPTLKLLSIPFTEGLEVECDIYGKGKVIKLFERTDNYPVIVAFDNAKDASYTLDGRIDILANQTLYPQFTI